MNAIRLSTFTNRQSRPSSPSPAATQVTPANANGYHSLPPVEASASEPAKPRSRSLSRQVAERVSNLQLSGPPRAASVLPSQPLGGKRVSPPSSRAPTPRIASTPLPSAPGTPLAPGMDGPQGGAFMEALGLRLNEQVNKACTGVDFKAKKGFRKGSGWGVGESVVKELPYPPNDHYLIRAILRTAVRSLSIYTTRLESLLLPALTEPALGYPLNLASIPNTHPLNSTQYYAVSVAHAAWETCEVLEQALETGKWPKFVADALRPTMDKFDLIVGKVIQPLLKSLRRDLVLSLDKHGGASPPIKGVPLSSLPAPGALTLPAPNGHNPPSRESTTSLAKLTKSPSSGGTQRQLPIPVLLQQFAARVDGAKKVMEIVCKPCADDGEGWITGVVVAVVWRSMCVVAEREWQAGGQRPPSPTAVSKALHHASGTKPTATLSMGPPAALTGVTAKLNTILPSRTASRAPSPPRSAYDPMTHALLSLQSMMKRLVGDLVVPVVPAAPTSAEPPATGTTEAGEALHEALEALESLRIVSSAMHSTHASARLVASARRVRDEVDSEDPAEDALDDAVEDVPSILLLSVLIRQANLALAAIPHGTLSALSLPLGIGQGELPAAPAAPASLSALQLPAPAHVFAFSQSEYEARALSGFQMAEVMGQKLMQGAAGELGRVLAVLKEAEGGSGVEGEKRRQGLREAREWVEVLGLVGEARVGVKLEGLE